MGKNSQKNQPCLCGSGTRALNCCWALPYNEMLTKKRKIAIEQAFQEANIKLCLYPDSANCSEHIIRAHSIQNNKILTTLADNGDLYMLKPNFFEFGDTKLQKVGRAKATTFTGFCSKHDGEIFLQIESQDYIPGNKQQEALFAFRAFAKEWHAKLVSEKFIENQKFTNSELEAVLMGTKLALDDINQDLLVFKDILLKGEYDKIETKIITFDQQCSFSVCSGMTLPHDFKGHKLEHFTGDDWVNPAQLFINIFPQNGKTHVLLSYFKKDSRIFKFLDNQLINKSPEVQKDLLSRLIVGNCENIVFSPQFINQKGGNYKKALEEKFAETITVYVGESTLSKDIELSLFN